MDRVVASFDSCGHRRERKRRKGNKKKRKKKKKEGRTGSPPLLYRKRMGKKGEADRDEGKRMTSFRGS